jgi:hypothetical protein
MSVVKQQKNLIILWVDYVELFARVNLKTTDFTIDGFSLIQVNLKTFISFFADNHCRGTGQVNVEDS